MKIKRVILTNFRGYRSPTVIDFNDLTVFVGRNDVGKSTILEALDLFFNDGKGVVKLDKADITVGAREYTIEVVFTDLPEEVVVDATFRTTLADEFLLNDDGDLDIIKKYTSGTKFAGTYIRATHPSNPECANLLLKKVTELRAIIRDHGIECDNQATNAVMRKAIWNNYADDLRLAVTDLDVTAGDDTKKIWSKLSSFLPVYSLFQSDRQNTDGDKEVQDPLKTAVSQFFQGAELQEKLNEVAYQVEKKLREVSNRTLEKLREMDPAVADTLKPVIPSPAQLKWADVFKSVSITADEDIPINKRGSGVKRLVLLNFFRAEAERRQEEGDSTGIIYAIEEPETSQHFSNQKILADALISLSRSPNTQVILTTHSGVIVKMLQFDDLRLIAENDAGDKYVTPIQSGLLVYPSMNEVNYTAFGEVTEEYHDELYGFIDGQGWLADYENGKTQIPYVRVKRDGSLQNETHSVTKYIRDVMHHPENTNNTRYSYQMLIQSVTDMRSYIETKLATTAVWLGENDE
jgi:predicted ATP-dependent endonuclease of OLD family